MAADEAHRGIRRRMKGTFLSRTDKNAYGRSQRGHRPRPREALRASFPGRFFTPPDAPGGRLLLPFPGPLPRPKAPMSALDSALFCFNSFLRPPKPNLASRPCRFLLDATSPAPSLCLAWMLFLMGARSTRVTWEQRGCLRKIMDYR